MSIQFKIAFFFLPALLTAFSGYAQHKNVAAYLVTTANDTVQGELKLQKEKKRLRSIRFKPVGENSFTSYSPAQIKAYGIGDSLLFVAREVKAEEQPVFLKVLVNGPTRLYAADNLSSAGEFYVQRPGEQVVQLQKRHNLAELNYMLSDCPEMESNSSNSRKNKYSGGHLSNTIHAYNTCSHPDEHSEILFRPTKINYLVGVQIGSHFGNIIYKNYYTFFQKHFNNKVPLAPGLAAGVFLNISEPGSNLMLQAELLYKQYKSSHTVQESRYTRSFDFKANAIQMPFLLQFKLPRLLKTQPYLNAGLSFTHLFDPVIVHEIKYAEDDATRNSKTITEGVRNWSNGFVGGAGLYYNITSRNRLLLDFQYSSTVFFSGFQVTTGFTL
ncbi:outer membrane beta-barrel protein [Botryobacter ruber]|uniref:outer membrane beta-barrel protein n=1 Tax=Botryobacter ruber TaxID=2171629 RepID=UPI000E0B6D93|nr:outer membrane beta-barrel protein [Botryobacter ruber]